MDEVITAIRRAIIDEEEAGEMISTSTFGTVIDDVSGSVTAVEGSLLLGQSFLHPFQIVANR